MLIRVGLASDLEGFHLPCCRGRVTLSLGGESITLEGPLTVEPAAEGVEAPEHRLQVAALKDEIQAEHLGRDLAERTDWPADVRFDAATGLYRVRLGRFATRERADAARARLAGLGVGGAWVTQEGGSVAKPALRVRWRERSFRVLGRWLVIEPDAGSEDLQPAVLEAPRELPITVEDPAIDGGTRGAYRGRLLLYLNDRGSLNLINELPLEQYLRGVVPRELGPALYPRLEALKAQAVAARTYALRHLGEFRAEGFDLCAGVRCQVYGGVGAEHPLSDRAVTATRGQVLLAGDELIEALYSATCGGHTEDAELVFPWMEAPYLRAVPCAEAGTTRLGGEVSAGGPFPEGLTRRLFPPSEGSPPQALEGRLRALAEAAGLPLPDDRLASLERREVRRFVRSLFDLVLDPGLFADPMAPLPALADHGRRRGGPGGVRRASLLSLDGLEEGAGTLREEEEEWMVLSLALLTGLLEEEELRFRALVPGPDGSTLRGVSARGRDQPAVEIPLPETPLTFRRSGGETTAAVLELAPGDLVTLYRWRGAPRALVQDLGSGGGGGADGPHRAARLQTWSRFRSDARLGELIDARYPGLGFEGVEVLSRGISGRVGAIRLLGREERSVEVEGLAVRWTLDLPDTRFEARRIDGGPGKGPGWLFTGGGWGHGVGMCQTGAYAMAGRGLDYRQILRHYYTGVHLGRLVMR